jgi:hypothetical protein
MPSNDADNLRKESTREDHPDRTCERLGMFFRPSQMEQAVLTRDKLRTLVRQGTVEWIGRGLYRLTDAEPTESYSLATAWARVPTHQP